MTQLDLIKPQTTSLVDWTPTQQAGLKRLADFVPQAGRAYAASRNYDLGPDNLSNVSTLSPWLRYRAILEQDVLDATLEKHSQIAAEKFIQEVFWRGYFKGWLEHRSIIWDRYVVEVRQLESQLETSSELRSRFENAVSGKTGIKGFDDWANQLAQTGYLHNHARMWFASIWIFTLDLPWQLGADFFYRHLLDADPASNTLSWRWVAGLHTKGKHYLARRANIEKYTKGRFSPHNLNENTASLFEDFETSPTPIQLPPTKIDITEPYGLLMTHEDCHLESLALNDTPNAICGINIARSITELAMSQAPQIFINGLMRDALKRASAHYQCDAQFIETNDSATALIDWANQHDFKIIITSFAPTGQVRSTLNLIKQQLGTKHIQLIDIARPYDALCWPHTQKGFFKLKQQIPTLLKALMA